MLFRLVLDGNTSSARFYKFASEAQQYSSGAIDLQDVCASLDEGGDYHCGIYNLGGDDPRRMGLRSTLRHALRPPSDSGEYAAAPGCVGGRHDGLQALEQADDGRWEIYDECRRMQPFSDGVLELSLKVDRT